MTPLPFFLLLSIPFFLNDFLFAAATEAGAWLFVDYATKIFVLFMVAYAVECGRFKARDFGFVLLPWRGFAAWTLLLTLTGVLIDQLLPSMLSAHLPSWRLFKFPAIDNPWVLGFDLSFGLILTAVSEEAVFRGAALLLLAAAIPNRFVLVAFSCLIFGAIHWGLGPALMISAAVWGILPAISVLVTRSIYPALIAHYVTNFVDFSGLGL